MSLSTAVGSNTQKIEILPKHEQKGIQRLTCSLSCLATALLIAALAGVTFIVLSRMQFFGPVNSAGSLGALWAGSTVVLSSIVLLAIFSLAKTSSDEKTSSTLTTNPSSSAKSFLFCKILPFFKRQSV